MKQFIYGGILTFLVPTIMLAQGSSYKLDTTIHINESDTIATNVIAAGQFIDILGYLNDDLFSASKTLVIQGSVNDDAIVTGQNITMRGTIGDMMIAAGETVTIDGEIAGDLFAAGNEIHITPNARIGGNIALAGNEVFFEGGVVEGWARIAGNEITMDGTIRNFVELYGNDFIFGDNYAPSAKTMITTNRKITREDINNAPADLEITIEKKETWGAAILISFWFYISLLIVGIFFILLFPQTTVDIFRFSGERYFKNTGMGLLLFLGVPITIVVLFILLLTIPLALIILLLYILSLTIGYLLVALILGTSSIRYFKSDEPFSDYYWGLTLGIVLIFILTALPFVGGIINIILIFFGLGTLLSYLWKVRENVI